MTSQRVGFLTPSTGEGDLNLDSFCDDPTPSSGAVEDALRLPSRFSTRNALARVFELAAADESGAEGGATGAREAGLCCDSRARMSCAL